jgi:hypothetical protein
VRLDFREIQVLNPNFAFLLTPEDANYFLTSYFEECHCLGCESCSLVDVYRHFRGMHYFHHQVSKIKADKLTSTSKQHADTSTLNMEAVRSSETKKRVFGVCVL